VRPAAPERNRKSIGDKLKPVRIALLGCGTVGGGVVKLMLRNPDKY